MFIWVIAFKISSKGNYGNPVFSSIGITVLKYKKEILRYSKLQQAGGWKEEARGFSELATACGNQESQLRNQRSQLTFLDGCWHFELTSTWPFTVI